MSSGHQRIKWRRNITENFNRLSRVHQRYRQTDGRRHIANMNMSSRSLKTIDCIFMKTLPEMYLLVKFWKSAASESGSRNLSMHFQHCNFPHFVSYLWKNWADVCDSFSLDKKFLVKFLKSSWPAAQMPRLWLWTSSTLAEVCTKLAHTTPECGEGIKGPHHWGKNGLH